jgi:NitT/TauT family transport system substrate-binding protein
MMDKQNFKTVLLRILVLSSLLFFPVGCDLKPQQPLKIGTNVWPGYEILYLAHSLGYYQNTVIKMVELPSATEVSHAFLHQLLDVVALTLDEALTLAQEDEDIRIILVIDVSNGGDVLLAKPSITTLAAIKSRRIGVENTAVGAILLDGALTAARLKPADIAIIPLSVDEHLAAYQQDKVDAIVTFDPVKTQLLKSGAKSLFDSSKIPNRIVDVLVTRQTIINERAKDLKQLLQAYFKALSYLNNHPGDSAVKISARLGIEPSEVMPQFNGLLLPDLQQNQQFLTGQHAILKNLTKSLSNLMWQQQLLVSRVQTDVLINGDLLPTLFIK